MTTVNTVTTVTSMSRVGSMPDLDAVYDELSRRLFAELDALTDRGRELFAQRGWLARD